MRTLTASRLFKDEGKVRDSKASLVNSGAIADCATPETSAWSDRAYTAPSYTQPIAPSKNQKDNYAQNAFE